MINKFKSNKLIYNINTLNKFFLFMSYIFYLSLFFLGSFPLINNLIRVCMIKNKQIPLTMISNQPLILKSSYPTANSPTLLLRFQPPRSARSLSSVCVFSEQRTLSPPPPRIRQ